MTTTAMSAFDQQVQTLLEKGYAEASGLSRRSFLALLSRLRPVATQLRTQRSDAVGGWLACVIVVKGEVVATETAMRNVVRAGRTGHIAMAPVQPGDFTTINRVRVPDGKAYLLVGIDRGTATLNVRPEDALKQIVKKRRSPLTIDEGVSILVQHPDFLQRNHCFSLLASRRDDQRVPALWLDAGNRPKLGWCWDRNPHTWLGSASCLRRIGLPKT